MARDVTSTAAAAHRARFCSNAAAKHTGPTTSTPNASAYGVEAVRPYITAQGWTARMAAAAKPARGEPSRPSTAYTTTRAASTATAPTRRAASKVGPSKAMTAAMSRA